MKADKILFLSFLLVVSTTVSAAPPNQMQGQRQQFNDMNQMQGQGRMQGEGNMPPNQMQEQGNMMQPPRQMRGQGRMQGQSNMPPGQMRGQGNIPPGQMRGQGRMEGQGNMMPPGQMHNDQQQGFENQNYQMPNRPPDQLQSNL